MDLFMSIVEFFTDAFDKVLNLFKTYRKLTGEKQELINFAYEAIACLKDGKISDAEVERLVRKLYALLRKQNLASQIKEV